MVMENGFVNFLNSVQNYGAANQNAIAEMAIQSPYFEKIQVERKIIDFLHDKITNNDFIILTGHAGDGKTTLLSQVIRSFGVNLPSLEPVGTVNLGDKTLQYAKDFSELTHEAQDEIMRSGFKKDHPVLLIANTGPLMNSFKRICLECNETDILSAMDTPAGKEIYYSDLGKVFILNIARVDNTDFIVHFLRNIIQDELWNECESCPHKNICHIISNRNIFKNRFPHASKMVNDFYVWLQEYDKRATIRQMTAHFAFSFTGGMTCQDVAKIASSTMKYDYLFSNLFFGCKGATPLQNAQNLECVKLINEAGFDKKPTLIDYRLFNERDYSMLFVPDSPLSELLDKEINGSQFRRPEEVQTVVKRAYLFFGSESELDREAQRKQTFSEWFDTYLSLRNNGGNPIGKMKETIYQAINTLFIGEMTTGEDSQNIIKLTLRRNNEQTCNVQLLSGRIATDDISFECVPEETIAGYKQYRLVLRYKDLSYPIGLPLLNYFNEIHRGIILTDIDPLLSNGIDSLKAELLERCDKKHEDNEVPVVFLQGSHWTRRTLIINEHSIDHH